MPSLEQLKKEVNIIPENSVDIREYLMSKGYREHLDKPMVIARASAVQSLFTEHEKHIYENDLIAGSLRGTFSNQINNVELKRAHELVESYGYNSFWTNADHFAPDYQTVLSDGLDGIKKRILCSIQIHQSDLDAKKKLEFLNAANITISALQEMLLQYSQKADELSKHTSDTSAKQRFDRIKENCLFVSTQPPETFEQALQLVWICHVAFVYEGRYAMALGRMDQYLYPFYERDINSGILTVERAKDLIACTLYKITEVRYKGHDDVVNICIGGVKPNDGSDAVNELSYVILHAVRDCNVPGPNLSARIHSNVEPRFIDECLKVIGTGLGYPALMNDEVNIPSLQRHGYSLEDCRDYCMVGCIENFIQGKQPPWSDGRYNVPKFLELALNNGVCMQTGLQMGPKSGKAENFATMDDFMTAFKAQSEYGAAEYMAIFKNENERYNKERFSQPFLSCFCSSCIERGLDINDGGSLYPSVHGAACMGIATVADSLAAIEKVVYGEKSITAAQLRAALLADFLGYNELRLALQKAPKYGNNDDFVDKYAVWYVDYYDNLFSKYHTWDGGDIYIGIASNTTNIPAGLGVAATPDGRNCGQPLSDAASPMHGMDKNGPTAVINSTTKPNYKLASCGTVLNQKFSPSMFAVEENRKRLAGMIKTYFSKGGQEMQINAVSREVLTDAIENPSKYQSLVVRVSGFSAFYTSLSLDIQKDILERTEHE